MNTPREPGAARPDPAKLTFLIFGIIAFMYFTGEVLKPLSLAVLLSFALAPAARFLERRGLPRAVAVMFTVLISLGILGGVGYVVGNQLTSLVARLPQYQENIEEKVGAVFGRSGPSTTRQLQEMADRVTARIAEPPTGEPGEATPITRVEVVSHPSFQERFRSATGPYVEFLGVSGFVLILVLFILTGREQLRDRIVGLFGARQVSVTTRTMQEIGQRISRYLATFTLMNSGFGLVIGLGLWAIGVPYAVLWGVLAALLRFIPYVGAAVAFGLPLIFSFAQFPGWIKPLEVAALFIVVEVVLNSFLEPIIYGRTTGISALSLLVAAMFWTWLWGALGLLLSTPLTVCLAVLGKYVPSLWVFSALLNEESELEPDVRFYQRLVALDREGAREVAEEALKQSPRAEVFDRMLVPALHQAEWDFSRGELDEAKREFVWQLVGDLVDESGRQPELSLETLSKGPGGEGPEELPTVLGLVADDRSDRLILRMLAQLLTGSGLHCEILDDADTSLQLVEEVGRQSPAMVVVSHLPPEGSTVARYLVRRLRSHYADLPILVGRWARPADAGASAFVDGGATKVVTSLAEAREAILGRLGGRKGELTAATAEAGPALP